MVCKKVTHLGTQAKPGAYNPLKIKDSGRLLPFAGEETRATEL